MTYLISHLDLFDIETMTAKQPRPGCLTVENQVIIHLTNLTHYFFRKDGFIAEIYSPKNPTPCSKFLTINTDLSNYCVINVFDLNDYNTIEKFLDRNNSYQVERLLEWICWMDDLDLLKYLYETGIKLTEIIFKENNSSLMYQIINSSVRIEIISFLLDIGCPYENNTIKKAVINCELKPNDECLEILKLLVNNNQEKYLNDALVTAAKLELNFIVRMFVDLGGDISYKKYKCLYHVISNRDIELVKYLLERIDIDNFINSDPTLLFRMVTQTLSANMVKLFLDLGMKIDDLSDYLEDLVKFRSNAVIKLYLEQVNYSCDIVDKTLYYAGSKDNPNLIKYLLELGPSKEMMNDCFIDSPFSNNIDIIKLYLDYGADISHKNYRVLSTACCKSSKEIIKFIIDNGADVNVSQAIVSAIQYRNTKIVKLLIKHGADISDINRSFNQKSFNEESFLTSLRYVYDKICVDKNKICDNEDPLVDFMTKEELFESIHNKVLS